MQVRLFFSLFIPSLILVVWVTRLAVIKPVSPRRGSKQDLLGCCPYPYDDRPRWASDNDDNDEVTNRGDESL